MRLRFSPVLPFMAIFVLSPCSGILALEARSEKATEAVLAEEKNRENPSEERWQSHLTVIKVFFEDTNEPQSRISLGITHKANPKAISGYTEKKNQSGTYMRTQFNVLICEAGPCEQVWSAGFVYTDEMGNRDTFGLTWKQTVFSGITPKGTVKRELLYCLNGRCKSLENYESNRAAPLIAEFGKYHLTWSNYSVIIRRSDLIKEVVDAGRSVDAY
ncbi:MAG TPA: hypothetical protein VEM40_12320 [Nitrospirota bacterium]|nr:hypothetical protein [Nitrospirota bacterium]